MKSVLISEPQAHDDFALLPYMWALLKTYCEREAGLQGRLHWLAPVFQTKDPELLLQPYRTTTPDVLGLSCYVWNWELQCQLAQRLKERHPGCLVVAGGPHPDYKDRDFFRKHPYIDLVAVKDGEMTFARLLEKVLAGDDDYRDIGGLYLPNPGHPEHIYTGRADVPSVFDHSPYLEQQDYLRRVADGYGRERIDVIWETNRGCPYSCSFCDWGSNTMSKVRRFEMDRIRAEVNWFAEIGVKNIFLTDANFGILKRDLEIADLLNDALEKHGHPRLLHYNPAKNNPDHMIEIHKKFSASGISPVYPFAIQHTDAGVLAATDRANISVAKQRSVVKEVLALNGPTLTQVILGIPGDTYDLWRGCLTDLMDWGLHDNYQVLDYLLLPNAPAADPDFRERWKIETIRRWVSKDGTGQRRKRDMNALSKGDVIVSSKSFSSDDWVKMKVYAGFVKALHNFGLTRLIAMYLHFGHAVSYRELYDAVIDDHFGSTELYARLSDHFHDYLNDETAVQDLEVPQLPEHPLCFEAGRWLFIQLCWSYVEHTGNLRRFLAERFPDVTHLESAIDYQFQVVILPDHETGQKFRTDFDWVGYFAKASQLTSYESLGEPDATPGAVVEVRDEVSWTGLEDHARRSKWIDNTREATRKLSTTFRELHHYSN